MADAPDPQELARRYLDLWQQHLTQAATDPELAAAMATFWQNLPAGMASVPPAWPLPAGNPSAPGHDATGPKSRTDAPTDSAPGTAADAASPDGSSHDLDKLLGRLAAVEKRLDAMERKPGPRRKRAAKGPAKRKS